MATTLNIDFRALTKYREPVLLCFGSDLGRRAAMYVSEIIKGEGGAAHSIDVSARGGVGAVDGLPSGIRPRIFTLDVESAISLHDYSNKKSLIFSPPYRSATSSIRSAKLKLLDVNNVHKTLCQSSRVFVGDEMIRQDVQFRHSQFISLMPQMPSVESFLSGPPKICDIYIQISDMRHLEFIDDIDALKKLGNIVVCLPAGSPLLGPVYKSVMEGIEVCAPGDIAFRKIKAGVGVFMGRERATYPPCRALDLALANIPIVTLHYHQTDFWSGGIPSHCMGNFVMQKNQNEQRVRAEVLDFVGKVFGERQFALLVSSLQKKELAQKLSGGLEWIKVIGGEND